MGSLLNSAYQSNLSGQLATFPAAVRAAAESGVAVAAALAHRLPAPIGARVLRAAQEAYVNGMSEAMLVTAGMLLVGAVLMAVFMPARASSAAMAEVDAAEPVLVAGAS
jgi:DHA2 family integral membrane protein (MFS transporter)